MDSAVLESLRHVPQEEYARRALKIVAKGADDLCPLDLTGRPGQVKLNEAIERQKAEGKPVRIVLVKSRQFGGSTWIQGEMMKRATTTARRKILIVAHRLDTAESLFSMGQTMWENLPDNMRPPSGGFVAPTRGAKILVLGEKTGGIIGWPNSKLAIDTAEEAESGRGLTYTDLHLTEAAYWRDPKKALALMNAVPDREGTSIYIESTANGQNWFHTYAKNAAAGRGKFELVFVGFHEDPDCAQPFLTPEEREEFIATIGRPGAIAPGTDEPVGPMAEDEMWLMEAFGCTPEQLNFRRTTITDRCLGKVELFRQEYPATWEEAFVGSGRQVFSVVFTARAAKQAGDWSKVAPEDGGPQKGLFVGSEPVTRVLSDGEVHVPTKVIWTPESDLTPRTEWWPGRYYDGDPLWTIWMPRERTAEEWRQALDRGEVDLGEMEAGIEQAAWGPRQYIIGGDAAGDTYNDVPTQMAEMAFNTLVGIDHVTGEQVAEWRGRVDHDLVAAHAFLCGMFLNWAWLSIERTGGYGGVILDRLQRRYYYRKLYTEKMLDDKKRREVQKLGWDTNRRTKPAMEATGQALLREGSHGIKSPVLAGEFITYIKPDEKRPEKHGPMAGAFSDVLMAWLQAQMIRNLKPVVRPSAPGGQRANSMTRRLSH